MGVIVSIVMLGSLVLILLSPEVSVIARIIFVAAFLGIGWLLVWSRQDRHFKQFLGREMQNTSKTGIAAVLAEGETVSVKARGTPSQPFTYQVFDIRRKFAGSPEADRFLKQGYKYYHRYVLNLVTGTVFLWAAFVMLSFSQAYS